MNKVILTIGAPASGKSTWAREYAREHDMVVSERDAIRLLQGFSYSEPREQISKNERVVTKIQRGQIEAALLDGYDVIVADTNIDPKHRESLIKYCHQLGADVELKVFEVGLDELIMRDATRSDSVGPDVVTRFYHSLRSQIDAYKFKELSLPVLRYGDYEHREHLPFAYVWDLDGTLLRGDGHRSPYDYAKVINDEPIKDVVTTGRFLGQHVRNLAVSGRDDSCYEDSLMSLKLAGMPVDSLYVRKTGDKRPDWVIKNEIYDEFIIPNYNILGVFDDRDQVVRHLRARGITVFQVNYGRF